MLRLTRLRLTDFRSWAALEARFDAPVVAIAGENGAGKTNLLEAISLLGPGRGLRGARMAELGRRVDGVARPWAVAGRFTSPNGVFDIGTGSDPEGASERRAFRLDGQPVRVQAELADRVAAVWLTPQMDRLFQEGAAGRRRFLDRLAWALEPAHARDVAAHDNAMAQRNRLLAEGRAEPRWLAALEDAMARHAVAAAATRRALTLRLNAAMAAAATGGAFPAARMDLLCPIAAALADRPALAVEDALREGLAADRRRDAAAGGAARGAHRADMTLVHLPKDQPAELCSTGEQKALLVSVVLAHAALIAYARGFAPLLLLDEVAAHLDQARREALFAALAALPAQSFLTGTEAEVFRPLAGIAAMFRAADGKLIPEGETGSR
ncbi:DNA replication and repair protein RecF [Roseomonas alkaliterrae]|jgi:DNA replication and repair protein RecF|uniref:DNA replication and repair protein RecF n=2 Tax=Neoroseomonas alkaliterrae TaxID=1452450 RepID=A0A840Y188_9PROT|nr:DNA replication/repair protein RecF [Neoroseomonas alkaliterrae]MBB5688023.1 DNA replication and repair protein RecF [Neoroseomonas alkaliterrae]